MFVAKGEFLLGAPIGQAPAFLTNISLAWKGLPVTKHSSLSFVNCGRKKFFNIDTSYKTFSIRNLRVFVISWSVCPWRAFQA
jgi:hypothetical protein